ncbi:Rrf2 family transcriptional regulator [Paenibacillus wynnii]|uniref:Rrf2 family transcriptional regulator n=1 Tax=Paenibacillus wynnii TaxID=268407 RepID=UPI00278CDA4B|nr:Rrf2 family transcriptional regulator [Paenibacillus wynnii]MDQ0192816.1 DNA-binding IscR family transcriptional regulator [Paenibacillus wynnii]
MKQISTRFSMAVHILSLIAISSNEVTGDYIAGSVNTNPVVIRRIISMLKRAGLVDVRPGIGGAFLLRAPEVITLLDIYRSVNLIEDNQLFGVHEESNVRCQVGRNIEKVLQSELKEAQSAMELRLAQTTLSQITARFK